MGNGASAEVLSAKATRIGFADETRMDVDVSVKVRYGSSGETEPSDSTIVTKNKDLNIRVPVVWQDGKYAVDAMPLLIPGEDAADVSMAQGYSGTEVSMKEKEEIKQMLESFFKTYCEGSDQDVSYYLTADSEITHGLNGVVTFSNLKWVSAYYLEVENEYLANASIKINDNGREISQEMYLTLIKQANKYYIKTISVRPGETEIGGNNNESN